MRTEHGHPIDADNSGGKRTMSAKKVHLNIILNTMQKKLMLLIHGTYKQYDRQEKQQYTVGGKISSEFRSVVRPLNGSFFTVVFIVAFRTVKRPTPFTKTVNND